MTDTVEKRMRPGEARFEVRESKVGRRTTFAVYDRARGAYPGLVSGFGEVRSGASREEVEAEMARLAEHFGVPE